VPTRVHWCIGCLPEVARAWLVPGLNFVEDQAHGCVSGDRQSSGPIMGGREILMLPLES